jgi:hypothetical protein
VVRFIIRIMRVLSVAKTFRYEGGRLPRCCIGHQECTLTNETASLISRHDAKRDSRVDNTVEPDAQQGSLLTIFRHGKHSL